MSLATHSEKTTANDKKKIKRTQLEKSAIEILKNGDETRSISN